MDTLFVAFDEAAVHRGGPDRPRRVYAPHAAPRQIVSRFGGSAEPELVDAVAGALIREGTYLRSVDRAARAVEVFDEARAHLEGRSESLLLDRTAVAMLHKGDALGAMGRHRDWSLAVYDDVLERLQARPEPELLPWAARAMNNRSVILKEPDRNPGMHPG